MGIRSSGCAAVDAMDRIRISGNIIPQSWYKEILHDNGKASPIFTMKKTS